MSPTRGARVPPKGGDVPRPCNVALVPLITNDESRANENVESGPSPVPDFVTTAVITGRSKFLLAIPTRARHLRLGFICLKFVSCFTHLGLA